MSTRPHIVLSWPLRRTHLPLLYDRTSTIAGRDRVLVRYLDPILLKRYSGNFSRSGPELAREARWPCPGLHHSAVCARSFERARTEISPISATKVKPGSP